MKKCVLVLALLLAAVPAFAQAPSSTVTFGNTGLGFTAQTQPVVITPGATLAWEQTSEAPSLPASGYEYRLIVDGAPDVAVASTCVVDATDSTTYHCTSPVPALTPGTHVLTMFARVTNADGTKTPSPLSTPLNALVVILTAPQNLRIK